MAVALMEEEFDPNYPPVALSETIAQPALDKFTFDVRTRHRREHASPEARTFRQHLLACANAWNYQLNDAGRAGWTTISKYSDGARPNMKPPPPNGWNCFAMYWFALLMYDAPGPLDLTQGDRPSPTNIWLSDADPITQTFWFDVTWFAPPLPEAPSYLFVYHVRPDKRWKPAQHRFAHFAGYDISNAEGEIGQSFMVRAHYPFHTGEMVHVLVRHHCPEQCVENWPLDKLVT